MPSGTLKDAFYAWCGSIHANMVVKADGNFKDGPTHEALL